LTTASGGTPRQRWTRSRRLASRRLQALRAAGVHHEGSGGQPDSETGGLEASHPFVERQRSAEEANGFLPRCGDDDETLRVLPLHAIRPREEARRTRSEPTDHRIGHPRERGVRGIGVGGDQRADRKACGQVADRTVQHQARERRLERRAVERRITHVVATSAALASTRAAGTELEGGISGIANHQRGLPESRGRHGRDLPPATHLVGLDAQPSAVAPIGNVAGSLEGEGPTSELVHPLIGPGLGILLPAPERVLQLFGEDVERRQRVFCGCGILHESKICLVMRSRQGTRGAGAVGIRSAVRGRSRRASTTAWRFVRRVDYLSDDLV
jgi:hypothetical protein